MKKYSVLKIIQKHITLELVDVGQKMTPNQQKNILNFFKGSSTNKINYVIDQPRFSFKFSKFVKIKSLPGNPDNFT